MVDGSRQEHEPRVYSADLLRRVPQKLFLSEREYPAWLPVGISLLTVLTAMAWCWVSKSSGWGQGAAVAGSLAALTAGYATWLVIRWFLIPVLRARGFYPVVEYLPEENKVVISDRPGQSIWGEEHAVVTAFLDSMIGVVLLREGPQWMAGIRLRKGDILPISSSARTGKAEARELASDLAAMLSLPLSETPTQDDK